MIRTFFVLDFDGTYDLEVDDEYRVEPVQMQEYMEADVQLHYMEIQKRKEQREQNGATDIKRFLRVLLGV